VTLPQGSFSAATSQWVGCSGVPATATYSVPANALVFTASAALDPTTPAGVEVSLSISVDGKPVASQRVAKGALIPLQVAVRGARQLKVSALTVAGQCGSTSNGLGYGVLVDAVVTS